MGQFIENSGERCIEDLKKVEEEKVDALLTSIVEFVDDNGVGKLVGLLIKANFLYVWNHEVARTTDRSPCGNDLFIVPCGKWKKP